MKQGRKGGTESKKGTTATPNCCGASLAIDNLRTVTAAVATVATAVLLLILALLLADNVASRMEGHLNL